MQFQRTVITIALATCLALAVGMEIWQASPDYDQSVQQLDEILLEILLWGIIGIVFTVASLTPLMIGALLGGNSTSNVNLPSR
jgi:hypothetical protein